MRNQVLYAYVIFAISALLMTTVIFTVEARTVDEQQSFTSKGNGARVNQSGVFLISILPIEDSKEFSMVYSVRTNEGIKTGICPHVSDKIVKISALNKASIEFNTGDEKLGECIRTTQFDDFDISLNIQTEGESIVEEYEDKMGCEYGFCFLQIGTSERKFGMANGIIDEIVVVGASAEISKINQKVTYWIDE